MAMETIKLAAKLRDGSKKAKHLRNEGLVPAVVYGRGVDNRHLTVDYLPFDRAFTKSGESTLIDIEVEGNGTLKTLVKDVQYDPITDKYVHIDFYEVDLKRKLTAETELNFIGESVAVKTLGGTLVTNLESVEIECLPTDLVNHIDVDLSTLATFEDVIRVKDLPVPDGIEILNDPENVIVAVEEPKSEEELKAEEEADAAATAADVTEIKTEGELKKEEEEAKKAEEAASTEGEAKKKE